jgi:hypothetical protein
MLIEQSEELAMNKLDKENVADYILDAYKEAGKQILYTHHADAKKVDALCKEYIETHASKKDKNCDITRGEYDNGYI